MDTTSNNDSSRRMAGTLLRNASYNVATQIVLLILSLAVIPYLVNSLGGEAYGLYALLLTYTQFLTIVDFGVNGALVRYLSRSLAQGRGEEASQYVNSALVFYLLVACAVAAIGMTGADFLVSALMNVSPELQRTARLGFQLAWLGMAVKLVNQPFSAVLAGCQRFDLINVVSVVGETGRLAGILLLVLNGYGLVSVMTLCLATALGSLCLSVWFVLRSVREIRLRPFLSLRHARDLFSFSAYLLVSTISGRVVHSFDKIIIGFFLPIAALTTYAVPYSVIQKFWTFINQITSVVFPAASSLAANSSRVRRLYLTISRGVASLSLGTAIGLAVFGDKVLAIWIGPVFSNEAYPVLLVLTGGLLGNTLARVPCVVSQAVGSPQIAARFAVLNALCTGLSMLVIVPLFGVLGAASCFAVCQLMLAPAYVRRVNVTIGVRGAEYLRTCIQPNLLPAASMLAVGVLSRPFVTSAVGAVVCLVGSGACFVAVALASSSDDDRALLRRATGLGRFAGQKV